MIEICAEAGVAHIGSPGLAYKLIDAAKGAGADVVKFQTFDVDKLLRPESPDRWMLNQLCLPRNEFIGLARYAEGLNIEFMSTPGDVDSLKFLVEEVGVKRIKIGSDDLTYKPLVQAAATTQLKTILSTGMATMSEVRDAAQFWWVEDGSYYDELLTVLHCVSSYPTSAHDANLRAMEPLRDHGFSVGYSDHTQGIYACIAAAALGAVVIEKHIMLNVRHRGPDHIVSLDPLEFQFMVSSVREVELMLGHGRKEPCDAEKDNIARFRKDRDGLRGLLS